MLSRSVLCASLFLASCSTSDSPPDYDWTSFDATVEAFLAANQLEGATAVVVHRDYGVLHARGFGAFPLDRVSLLASSSKILSAGVLVRLADQGLLDLDAPVSTYLADFGAYKTDIPVASLVSNSSGLVSLTDDPTYAPYICQYLPVGFLEDCGAQIYLADDAADRIPPDTEFHYGGGQWQLAGAIAEHVSGKPWSQLIAETYGPCDAPSIGYSNVFASGFGNGGVSGSLAYPSFFDGDVSTLPVTDNPNIEGGGYSNVLDYGAVLLMHLRGGRCDGGRALSAAGVERMRTDRIGPTYGGSTGDPTMPGYGLGWWVSRDEPGYVSDGGAYGATPFLDLARGYGVMIILEANGSLGYALRQQMKPVVDAIFDAAN